MQHMLSLDSAVATLTQGGVIAYPTEAVWGLGCDPRQQAAVLRLLEIKRRPVDKGVIVVAASVDVLHAWVDMDALAPARRQEVLASWPGPHTWILPITAQAPRWVTGTHDGLAVRISAHPVVAALCAAWAARWSPPAPTWPANHPRAAARRWTRPCWPASTGWWMARWARWRNRPRSAMPAADRSCATEQ